MTGPWPPTWEIQMTKSQAPAFLWTHSVAIAGIWEVNQQTKALPHSLANNKKINKNALSFKKKKTLTGAGGGRSYWMMAT